MRGVFVAVSLLALAAGTAEAQERPRRVGVVATVHINLEEEEAASVADTLGEGLREELVVDVVAGEEAQRRLPEEGVSDQCFLDRACLTDVGDRLDVEEVLFLVLVRVGDEVQIDTVWAEVESGESASRRGMVLEADGDHKATFAGAASALLPDAPGRPAPPAPAAAPSGASGAEAPLVEAERRGGRRGRRITTGVWIAGGAATLALVGGVGFGLSAKSIDDSLDADGCDQTRCPDAQARVDRLRRRMFVADLLYGVSAAAAVTAAVLYWTSEEDGDPPLEVGTGPGVAGLAVGGRF